MEIHWKAAALAGGSATIAMTVLMYALVLSGIRVDIPWILGLLLFKPERRVKVYGMGIFLHFVAGLFFGLAYALLWAAMNVIPGNTVAGWLWGLFFGAVHYAATGISLALWPAVHPRMGFGKPLPLPGLFGRNLGPLVPMALLMLHLVYGLIVGAVYAGSF